MYKVMHVVPVADLREHVEAICCWCNPDPLSQDGPAVFVHNAADGREVRERATGQAIRGKPWICVIDGVPIENDPWVD